jgi:hypothetical protein
MPEHHAPQVSTIAQKLQDVAAIQEAIRMARYLAIQRHVVAGRKIPQWQDGRVVWVDLSQQYLNTSPAVVPSRSSADHPDEPGR